MFGGHAVVLGAGFAGLLAARTLAGAYERVTLIERDSGLDPGPRRGVPQAHHAHLLLCRGLVELERLFPGLGAELAGDGALVTDPGCDLTLILGGHRLTRAPLDRSTLQVTRSRLDDHLRRRVLELPGIDLMTGRDVVGLVPATVGRRCDGVRVVRRTPGSPVEIVPAGLVVDATGRGSRLDHWLAAEWHTAVPEERLTVDVRYASQTRRLPDGLPDGALGALISATPDRPYGLALLAVEGGRHLVTMVGVGGHRPARDEAGLRDLVRAVAPADLADAVLAGSPDPAGDAAEIRRYRIPEVRRLRYERAQRLPAGVIAIGDALCGLNPVYAQGMTVAALHAAALEASLAGDPETLSDRYFHAAAAATDAPWAMAVGSDLALPHLRGQRTLGSRITAAVTGRIQRVAATDPEVARRFVRVMALLDPPTELTRPGLLGRLIKVGHPRDGEAVGPALRQAQESERVRLRRTKCG